jgi:hypothetical protein
MADQPKTGSVTSKSGKVTVTGKIVTGFDIEGAASDAVLKTAFETMQHLQTGDVSGAKGVEAGEIITGLRYLNPQAPDHDSFVAELKALRDELAGLAGEADAPDEVSNAIESLDETLAETQKEKPLAKRVINRLRESLEFISDAGKALDAASKTGPLIVKAIGTATVLYRAAQVLF